MVPVFDGDERVEMQGMIYDLASFNCERQNALLIIEDLRWVIMEDGTGQFSSHRQEGRVLIDLPQEDFVDV